MNTYKKIIAALAVSGMMLTALGPVGATAWATASADGSKKTEQKLSPAEKTIADLDAKLLQTALKTMRQLAGKEIELASATESNGTWFMYPEGGVQSGQVVINEKTGKVTSARAELPFQELSATMQKQAMDALKNIDPAKTFTLGKVQRSISFFGTEDDGIIYTYVNGEDANVQFANDKRTYASVVYDPGAVDVNLRQAAARAVKDFCGRAFQAKQISHTQGEGRDVWRFESEATSKGSISVTFGAKTGNVWSIFNSYASTPMDAEVNKQFLKNVKEKDAVSAAVSVSQKVFGIDMKDYAVKRDKELANVFNFTKQEFPSIEVELNKSKQVAMFRITPAKGSKMD
ncbi:hypothetical protein ABEV00_09010 [Paenibacillus thiaminolyticus]|uniref:hypothetical protein n=1 Tax=Paenibacillus TaxID=44249 RepID=UPI0010596C53|nr:hypothetical protein [Paenibacillus dendritiformis]TDL56055.1 hypothetical protein E2R60_11080 [Paenibacillus dendritiformis]